jgi:hypothetical protein
MTAIPEIFSKPAVNSEIMGDTILRPKPQLMSSITMDAEFESKHPRDKDGKFTNKGKGNGNNGRATSKTPSPRSGAKELRDRGGVSGSPGVVQSSDRPASTATPLEGLPTNIKIPGYPDAKIGPSQAVRDVATKYMESVDWEYKPPTTYAKLNRKRAKRIADAFDALPHDPQDPAVQASYRAMIDETAAQWEAIEASGLKVEWITEEMLATTGDPYAATPRLATEDINRNNHFWCFPTDLGFGSDETFDPKDNPLLEKTGHVIGGKEVMANDLFRIVHDYFGHVKEGNGFRAGGEENAWRAHSAMFSPLARGAMSMETRGQNSWVNFGPKGKFNRTASAADTVYADQKVNIMPEWAVTEGDASEDYTAGEATPEFKKWFGRSKAVEADGSPKTVYHGTKDDFDVFDQKAGASHAAPLLQRDVSYFTSSPEVAGTFAGIEHGSNVKPVYLKMENPLVVNAEGRKFHAVFPEPIDAAKSRGHDGVIVKGLTDSAGWSDLKSDVYVVFNANQIKSATGNSGNFDPNNPSILMSSLRMAFDESKHARAPGGGVTVNGTDYEGGEFIPGATQGEVNKAAREQRFDDSKKGVGQDSGKKKGEPTAVEKFLDPEDRVIPKDEKTNQLKPEEYSKYTGIRYESGLVKPKIKSTSVRGEVLTEDVAGFLQDKSKMNFDLATGNVDDNPREMRKLAGAIAEEVEYAMGDPKSAAEWYKSTIEEAMRTVKAIYPEMDKDPSSEAVFKMVLAITSNGQDVNKNIGLAMDSYESWRKTGSFGNPNPGGKPKQTILLHLGLLEDLIEQKGTGPLAEFLEKEFTIREINDSIASTATNEFYRKKVEDSMVGNEDMDLEEWTNHMAELDGPDKPTKKYLTAELKKSGQSFIKGELIDSKFKVRGAYVFGSKLGSFFGNLSGHWDTITMDRWFMRTIGRVTGTLLTVPEKKLRGQLDRSLIGLEGGDITASAKDTKRLNHYGHKTVGETKRSGKKAFIVRVNPATDSELTSLDETSVKTLKSMHKRSKSTEPFANWLRAELINSHKTETSDTIDFRKKTPFMTWSKAKNKQYAGDAVFSPRGGVEIKGDVYDEGEEIPPDVVESLTRKEKKAAGLNVKSFTDKTFINMSNKNLWINLSKTNDAPRNGRHRDNIRKVFKQVGDIHEEKTGERVSNAVMQAALWFFEKRLYQNLGAPAARAAPTDYAKEARKHLLTEAPDEDKTASRKRRSRQAPSTPSIAMSSTKMPRKIISHPEMKDVQRRQDETDIASQMSKEHFRRLFDALMKKPKRKKLSFDEAKHKRGGDRTNTGRFSEGSGSKEEEPKTRIHSDHPLRIVRGAGKSKIPTVRKAHIIHARKKLGRELSRKISRRGPGQGGEVSLSIEEVEKVLEHGIVGFVSAARNPSSPSDMKLSDEQIEKRYKHLAADLKQHGFRYTKVVGKYGEEEDSLMVMAPEADKESILSLGAKYHQDSILYSAGNLNELVYTTGKQKGKANPGVGFERSDTSDDFYTEFTDPGGRSIRFTLGLDFAKVVSQALALIRQRLRNAKA